jgi:hypothetical protein
MKCLEQHNVFFALSDEKVLWIIKIDNNETIQLAKKTFYTNQTEVNNIDLVLILKKTLNYSRCVLLTIEIYF